MGLAALKKWLNRGISCLVLCLVFLLLNVINIMFEMRTERD